MLLDVALLDVAMPVPIRVLTVVLLDATLVSPVDVRDVALLNVALLDVVMPMPMAPPVTMATLPANRSPEVASLRGLAAGAML